MSALVAELRAARCDVEENAPLAPRTSVRVGGPAKLLVRPPDADAVAAALRLCASAGVAVLALGGGANCIVGDAGVDGCVLKLGGAFATIGEPVYGGARVLIEAGAGASSRRIATLTRERGLVGAEFIAGIPGTLGGMVAMNAGTRSGEMSEILEAVEIATAAGARWLPAKDLRLAYRHSELPPGGVVTRVRLALRQGSPEEAAASAQAMDKDRDYRKATQPLSLPNSGSVFANPPGDFAGRLIEACGLKGRALGAAQLSPVHANWIVNLGGARASDVVGLMALAKREVRSHFGVALRPEVKLIGTFEPPLPPELLEA